MNFQDKSKEELIKESERFNRATLDALSPSIAVLNEQGDIIFVNKAWRDFGADNSIFPLQKQEGYNYLKICDAVPVESEDFECAKSTAAGIRCVIRGEIKTFSIEYSCNSPNEERWFILQVTRFEGEHPVFVTVSHQNISERKKAETELKILNQTLENKINDRTTELQLALEKAKESEYKLQRAFLTCPESVTFTLLETGVYTSVNYGFTKLLGYSETEAIGKTSVELKVWPSEEERNRFKQLLNTDGRIENQEFQFLTKSGKLIDCLVSCSIIQINKVPYIFSITRDISDRKAIQEELYKAKKTAEEASRMKSEFLANMSHEIRTPLNAIVGFSNILQEKTEGNKLFSEYLGNIVQSSKVLLNLINDILDLSKVEAGRMVVAHKPVNMKSLVKEILSIFEMKAIEKGITLVTSISQDLPGSLITDEKYLRQIFFNLIGNAVKFTQVGSVEIGVTIIPKNEMASKIDFLISIKDSGIGIPENEIKSIFEPFIQVSRQSRSKYGGTGLGLSITRRLVELLGGTISVKSEQGKGSIFTVSLFDIEIGALKTDEGLDNGRAWLKRVRFKKPTILMAEDVLSNRQIIKLYLEQFNIDLVITENGEDCINLAHKINPDLVLMDMQMPIMDGYTAASLIKADANLKNIPIVALTASGIGEDKDKFAGIADDFLLKPVYKNDLLEILTKYLPYELEAEIEKTGVPIETISLPISAKEPLSIETKFELLQKYLPTVTKLQQNLNFDRLIAFEKDLEQFSEEQDLAQVKKYCLELKDCIETFNTEKIYATLMEISLFMKKEESWKL